MYTEYKKALHINERLSKGTAIEEDISVDLMKQWYKKINLPLNFEKEYLNSYGLNKKEFADRLNEINILPDTSKNFNWYNTIFDIISFVEIEIDINNYLDEESRKHTFFNFSRPVLYWVNKIIENSELFLNNKSEQNNIFVCTAIQSCFHIIIQNSLKVLIVELRNYGSDRPTRTPEDNYKEFIKLLTNKIFFEKLVKQYPLMMRSIISQCNMNLQFLSEVHTHFKEDYQILCNNFPINGNLINISMNLGDTHCKKKSVLILEFSKGKVVYKPKSLEINEEFNKILDYLNAKGLRYYIRKLRIVTKKTYGWQEFVEYEPCISHKDVHELYFKYGVYAALFYIFSASDMHMDNVVINRTDPYFIDLESLFQGYQGVPLQEKSAYENIVREIRDSVLSTCMFPAHISAQGSYDVSGITGHGGQTVHKGKYEILNKYRSDMMLVRTTYTTENKKNIAMLDDEFVNPRDYTQYIICGFSETYELIYQNKEDFISEGGLLFVFKGAPIRTIVRNTKNYSMLLKASTDPNYLENALYQDQLFDRLWGSLKDDINLKEIIRSEILDLQNGDIPYFSSELFACDLVDSRGHRFKKFLKAPISLQVIEKIKCMSDKDREKQLNYIKCAMAIPIKRWELKSNKINYLNYKLPDENGNSILLAAKDIDKKLRSYAFIHEAEDNINWIDVSISSNAQWQIHPMDGSLYDGILGPALFYAAIYQVTQNEDYLHLVNMIMKSSEMYMNNYSQKESISAFNGYASMAYVYYYIGIVTKEAFYKKRAVSFIKKCEKQINDDKLLDIIGGCAGTLIVALRIYQREHLDDILKIAIKCGERLVESAVTTSQGIGWRTAIGGGECLAGMSHGCAGMAWALTELYKYTHGKSYIGTAEKAIKYENTLYIPEDNNWMDMRNRENRVQKGFPEPVHWCHGAVGIGISRAMCYTVTSERGLEKDVFNAIQKTLESGFGGSDSMCHGSMGSIDLLLIAGKIFNKKEIVKQAQKIAIDLIKRANHDQWYSGIPQKFDSMGFMVGLSGIGYELLRAHSPVNIPSILTFSLPEESNG